MAPTFVLLLELLPESPVAPGSPVEVRELVRVFFELEVLLELTVFTGGSCSGSPNKSRSTKWGGLFKVKLTSYAYGVSVIVCLICYRLRVRHQHKRGARLE